MSAQRPVQPPHAVWLVLPEATRAIESTLRRRGLRGADLEDHRQVVLEHALLAAPPPATLGECIAMVQTIAGNLAIDTLRRTHRRSKVDAGPCEDPDERAANDHGDAGDRIDEQRQLDFVRAEIEAGRLSARQAAILTSAADEVPQPEIAAQMKLAHSTVRNELSAARRTVRNRWAAFAAAAFTVLGAIFLGRSEPDRVGSPPPYVPEVPPGPSDSVRPLPPTLHDVAEGVRQRAFERCEARDWAGCVHELDRAKGLDPEGDRDARVKKARDEATRNLGSNP